MSFALTHENIADIRMHALKEYPKESCGLIVDGRYVPCVNTAADPTKDFVIAGVVQARIMELGGKIQAIAHSHPDGPLFPSEIDMRSQITSGLPWCLVATDGKVAGPVEVWGNEEIAPIIGRTFMHGIRDCYSLVRDVYRLGKDRLKEQGIAWPLEPIYLPEYPREDNWWGTKMEKKQSLYEDNFAKAGFVKIASEEARPGDGFLIKVNSQTVNHAAVLCEDQMILHHFPARLSRRQPAALWARAADVWLRYKGPAA